VIFTPFSGGPELKVFGLDGYREGWVAVWLDDGNCGIEFFSTIAELLNHSHSTAMVDMPIGLPPEGTRKCDLEARDLLDKDCSRVFLGVRRGLLRFEGSDHPTANSWAKSNGKGISVQLFNLRGKLAEIDRFMTPERQETVRETHPELVFWRLNGRKPVPKKKTVAGLEIRRQLIRRQGILEINDWLDRKHLRKYAKPDDVLDACAAVLVARQPEPEFRIPKEPEMDERGLRMEIWY
jgi:predicted RNase H-like nuclease